MAKTQYVAVTTTGESGWFVVAVGMPGESKASVTEEAAQKICGYQWNKVKDIVTDTQLKNLFVCSKTEARSRFPRAYQHFLEGDVE